MAAILSRSGWPCTETDGDGQTNAEEYIYGTYDKIAESRFGLKSTSSTVESPLWASRSSRFSFADRILKKIEKVCPLRPGISKKGRTILFQPAMPLIRRPFLMLPTTRFFTALGRRSFLCVQGQTGPISGISSDAAARGGLGDVEAQGAKDLTFPFRTRRDSEQASVPSESMTPTAMSFRNNQPPPHQL